MLVAQALLSGQQAVIPRTTAKAGIGSLSSGFRIWRITRLPGDGGGPAMSRAASHAPSSSSMRPRDTGSSRHDRIPRTPPSPCPGCDPTPVHRHGRPGTLAASGRLWCRTEGSGGSAVCHGRGRRTTAWSGRHGGPSPLSVLPGRSSRRSEDKGRVVVEHSAVAADDRGLVPADLPRAGLAPDLRDGFQQRRHSHR